MIICRKSIRFLSIIFVSFLMHASNTFSASPKVIEGPSSPGRNVSAVLKEVQDSPDRKSRKALTYEGAENVLKAANKPPTSQLEEANERKASVRDFLNSVEANASSPVSTKRPQRVTKRQKPPKALSPFKASDASPEAGARKPQRVAKRQKPPKALSPIKANASSPGSTKKPRRVEKRQKSTRALSPIRLSVDSPHGSIKTPLRRNAPVGSANKPVRVKKRQTKPVKILSPIKVGATSASGNDFDDANSFLADRENDFEGFDVNFSFDEDPSVSIDEYSGPRLSATLLREFDSGNTGQASNGQKLSPEDIFNNKFPSWGRDYVESIGSVLESNELPLPKASGVEIAKESLPAVDATDFDKSEPLDISKLETTALALSKAESVSSSRGFTESVPLDLSLIEVPSVELNKSSGTKSALFAYSKALPLPEASGVEIAKASLPAADAKDFAQAEPLDISNLKTSALALSKAEIVSSSSDFFESVPLDLSLITAPNLVLAKASDTKSALFADSKELPLPEASGVEIAKSSLPAADAKDFAKAHPLDISKLETPALALGKAESVSSSSHFTESVPLDLSLIEVPSVVLTKSSGTKSALFADSKEQLPLPEASGVEIAKASLPAADAKDFAQAEPLDISNLKTSALALSKAESVSSSSDFTASVPLDLSLIEVPSVELDKSSSTKSALFADSKALPLPGASALEIAKASLPAADAKDFTKAQPLDISKLETTSLALSKAESVSSSSDFSESVPLDLSLIEVPSVKLNKSSGTKSALFADSKELPLPEASGVEIAKASLPAADAKDFAKAQPLDISKLETPALGLSKAESVSSSSDFSESVPLDLSLITAPNLVLAKASDTKSSLFADSKELPLPEASALEIAKASLSSTTAQDFAKAQPLDISKLETPALALSKAEVVSSSRGFSESIPLDPSSMKVALSDIKSVKNAEGKSSLFAESEELILPESSALKIAKASLPMPASKDFVSATPIEIEEVRSIGIEKADAALSGSANFANVEPLDISKLPAPGVNIIKSERISSSKGFPESIPLDLSLIEVPNLQLAKASDTKSSLFAESKELLLPEASGVEIAKASLPAADAKDFAKAHPLDISKLETPALGLSKAESVSSSSDFTESIPLDLSLIEVASSDIKSAKNVEAKSALFAESKALPLPEASGVEISKASLQSTTAKDFAKAEPLDISMLETPTLALRKAESISSSRGFSESIPLDPSSMEVASSDIKSVKNADTKSSLFAESKELILPEASVLKIAKASLPNPLSKDFASAMPIEIDGVKPINLDKIESSPNRAYEFENPTPLNASKIPAAGISVNKMDIPLTESSDFVKPTPLDLKEIVASNPSITKMDLSKPRSSGFDETVPMDLAKISVPKPTIAKENIKVTASSSFAASVPLDVRNIEVSKSPITKDNAPLAPSSTFAKATPLDFSDLEVLKSPLDKVDASNAASSSFVESVPLDVTNIEVSKPPITKDNGTAPSSNTFAESIPLDFSDLEVLAPPLDKVDVSDSVSSDFDEAVPLDVTNLAVSIAPIDKLDDKSSESSDFPEAKPLDIGTLSVTPNTITKSDLPQPKASNFADATPLDLSEIKTEALEIPLLNLPEKPHYSSSSWDYNSYAQTDICNECLTCIGTDCPSYCDEIILKAALNAGGAPQSKNGNSGNRNSIAGQGGIKAATSIVNVTDQVVAQRQDFLSRTQMVGVAAGDQRVMERGIWGKVSHSYTEQKTQNENEPGYNLRQKGFVVGGDADVSDNLVLGIAYGKFFSRASSKEIENDTEKVDTHVHSVYAEYSPKPNLMINARINHANAKMRHWIQHGRYVTSSGSTNAELWKANIEAIYGYNMKNIIVSPRAEISYDYHEVEKYNRHINVNIPNLVNRRISRLVKGTKGHKWTGTLGVGAKKIFEIKKVNIVPKIHFNVSHILARSNKSSLLNVLGQDIQSSIFKLGNHDRTTYNVGGYIHANKSETFEIGVGYDYYFRKGFKNHSSYVSMFLKF